MSSNTKESFLKELIREGQPHSKTQPQNVLLIDHSGTALAIMSKLITKHIPNVQVQTATTANDALKLLNTSTFNLITMSRNLPDAEDHELILTIRTELNILSTPLLLISGEKTNLDKSQISREYVNGCFDKNLGQGRLVQYIQSFLSTEPPKVRSQGHILYVADSPTAALTVTEQLSRQDYTYLQASDAEHALNLIQNDRNEVGSQHFDLLMVDIDLHGHLSARDLIREIRYGMGLSHEELPILVTVHKLNEHDAIDLNRIFAAGANDLIEKAEHMHLLIPRLNNLLSLQQQHADLNNQP